MAYRPLDVANGGDPRNHWKVVLFKNGEFLDHTSLYYPTKEKAEEIANYLNKGLNSTISYQRYVVKPHDPDNFISDRIVYH